MIRITFLAHSLRVGGAEVQLTALATGLDRTRYSPTVISFYDDGALLEKIREAGIPVITIGKLQRGGIFRICLRLAKAVKESKPDIVYSYLDFPNVVAALCKIWHRDYRLVWGIRASDMQLRKRGRTWRTIYFLEKLLARSANRIVCNSWAGQKHLEKSGFFTKHVTVIPNGIDTERFQPEGKARIRVRQELGLSDETIAVALVARLDPMKDHDNFLDAVAELGESLPQLHFFCVGSGDAVYGKQLKDRTLSMGQTDRITWLGEWQDVPGLLNACDMATLTSAYGEGFPNVVGEAMACGLPCVVTDVGDAAFVVGNTGLVVPVSSPAKLADAWRKMASFTRDQLTERGKAARHRAETEFPRKKMIDHSSECLEQVALGDL